MPGKNLRSKKIKNLLIIISVVLLLGSLGVYTTIILPVNKNLPTLDTLIIPDNAVASSVRDHLGAPIGYFYQIHRLPTESVPEQVEQALIATEDKRFLEHHGIDYWGLVRVFWGIVTFNSSAGGGSTITQQLVKNIYGRNLNESFAMPRAKYREWRLALKIENQFSKRELLLLYLNTVPFGDEVYGLETASHHYFGLPASKLETHQAATLIGMLKGNSLYHPRRNPEAAINRRNVVLSLMNHAGYLTADETKYWQNKPLGVVSIPADDYIVFGYAMRKIRNEVESLLAGTDYNIDRDGLQIITSIDKKISQEYFTHAIHQLHNWQSKRSFSNRLSPAQQTSFEQRLQKSPNYVNLTDKQFREKILEIRERHPHNHLGQMISITGSPVDSMVYIHNLLKLGATAIDPNTGAVRMYFGGHHARLHPYDHVQSKRQVASTIKPLVALHALQEGHLGCDYFENTIPEAAIDEGWAPKNADRSDSGFYSLQGALIHSANLPFVNLAYELDLSALHHTMTQCGWSQELTEDPSLVLGSAENSVWEMAGIYAGFANLIGTPTPFFVEEIKTAKGETIFKRKSTEPQVSGIDAIHREQVNQILTDVATRGTARGGNFSRGWAVKTGTSNGGNDTWTIAFTPEIVFVNWIGNSDRHAHNPGLHSGTLAVPLAAKFSRLYTSERLFEPMDSVACQDFTMDPPKEKKGLFDFLKKKNDKPKNKKSFWNRLFGKD
ncbi:MAG: transglycosylase domain-containing protein [Cryomorphaceae bacterium]|nr:transglycosylase domain-containing protein [Cryomorphaceae bacterium]